MSPRIFRIRIERIVVHRECREIVVARCKRASPLVAEYAPNRKILIHGRSDRIGTLGRTSVRSFEAPKIHPTPARAGGTVAWLERYGSALVLIILPQAFRRALPPYVGRLTVLVQASALTSVVGVSDLLG